MDLESCRHYFSNTLKDGNPMARLFRSSSAGYLYDTGTNKIMGCRDEVYELLRLLLETTADEAIESYIRMYGREQFLDVANEIIDTMKEENILLAKSASRFGLSDHFKNIDEILAATIHSINREKVRFTITTNGTRITPEIAQYLLTEGFSVILSIDGPGAIHDRYRRDREGKGTFQKTLKGLKILSQTLEEVKNGSVSLNVVYAPPYSARKLDEIHRYFKNLEWLPDNINILTYYPTEGSVPGNMVTGKDLEEDKRADQWAYEKYRRDFEQSGPMVEVY